MKRKALIEEIARRKAKSEIIKYLRKECIGKTVQKASDMVKSDKMFTTHSVKGSYFLFGYFFDKDIADWAGEDMRMEWAEYLFDEAFPNIRLHSAMGNYLRSGQNPDMVITDDWLKE